MRLKLFPAIAFGVGSFAMNYKNLNYEIETNDAMEQAFGDYRFL